ncbi:oxygen-dependent tRNA uridine(34) hydroxylase TrhO [Leptospira sp. GIMC2001]|uniref:oxygen-dependent tRNA uridine(34) hydroxylase TrhO n=1 Tax=Leptospira sp. GIMC2001 TaxID=1513297 RepID=UPI00234915EB|nr:rhodanese-related sulfurtransferase [Leptospira sp. GIMC2001]WCL51146.1 rhodanese-related sulfurtransferase [Leptospira sp. GIMC2001]
MARKVNIYDTKTLRDRIEKENFERINLSFYRYANILDPQTLRDSMFAELSKINVLGRIYLAREGINAQISIPDFQMENFKAILESISYFENMYLNIAVESKKEAFLKLIVKVRNKIVADGLEDDSFDVTNVGTHLNAEEFNRKLEDSNTICIDMRNRYESEVGHFEKAILPDAETFRDELPEVLEILENHKDKQILLYCTGGIRCEKASAFIKHHGYNNVFQLRGGIISYAQEIKQKNLTSKFHGKNFVFDERLGEKITDEVLGHCHICNASCDTHTNCKNLGCHVLMLICDSCNSELNGCCSTDCRDILQLPEELQKDFRRKAKKSSSLVPFTKSRLKKRNYPTLNTNNIDKN